MRSAIRALLPEPASQAQALRLRASHLPMRVLPNGRTARRRLGALRDLHRGQRCAILGNGPSLRGLDLEHLDGIPTFCLNRGYLLWQEADREPSYFVAVNNLVVDQFHEEIAGLSCPLFVPWICRERFTDSENAIFIELRNEQRFIGNPLKGVAPCGTVTIAALQLAFHMGFSTAILLGVDHRFQTQGTPHTQIRQSGPDPNHFRSDYFADGTVWNLPALAQSESGYRLARAAFDADGREIVNATPGSALEVFDRAALNAALVVDRRRQHRPPDRPAGLNRLGSLRHHAPRPLRGAEVRPGSLELGSGPPRISIVTPSLNQGRFLEATIRSVLDQGYPDLEYAIEDGGSEDGSRQIIERYAERLVRGSAAPDGGQAEALNRGFTRCSGEIMAYLNSDDLLLPGALSYVASYLERNPAVDVVYGHRVLIDEDGAEIGRQIIPRHDDEVLAWGDFIPQETLFWRRSIWESAGARIDEGFHCAMDWDLLIRFREAGAKMVRLPRFLGAFRVHDEQKTATLAATTATEEMHRIRERVHGRRVDQREVLRRVRPYLLRHVTLDRLYRAGLLRY